MTDIVHEWQGVLDKYMGDAIMAWWGAPDRAARPRFSSLHDRCRHALCAARATQSWTARNVPKLEMGVGINTGPMVYGNTGSNERFDFTVMGDAVNLASRLEGTNKEYGSNIIISGMTREQAADEDSSFASSTVIEVKGKTEPVDIYELLGTTSTIDIDATDLVSAWETAMELYRVQEFSLAQAAFHQISERWPSDGPAHMYAERCANLRMNPPGAGWDGVFVMTHK